ncbi:MAG: hypothetical protein AB2A00_06770 [Myxococcota bacterium]
MKVEPGPPSSEAVRATTVEAWIAAIATGWALPGSWEGWAVGELERLSAPPVWLVDLACTTRAEDALWALHQGRGRNAPTSARDDGIRLHLGMRYLAFLDGKVELGELLRELGEHTDRHNVDDPSCEAFGGLLTRLDGGAEEKEIRSELAVLLGGQREEAARALSELALRLE